jgi:steroid delta-isomerase-like uncharacterized protein
VTADDHKARLGRYVDAYNRAADDELNAFVTDDYVHHSNGDRLTLAQFKRGAACLRSAMPDFKIEIVEMIGEGDGVAGRWIGHGTHENSMFGEAVTGNRVAIYGTTVYHFTKDGRIFEDWEVFDEGDLRRQVSAPAD